MKHPNPKTIYIDGKTGKVIDYCDLLLEDEYAMHKSKLINIPVSKQKLGDMAYYDSLGQHLFDISKPDPNKPIGKQVV